ncbi:MAG: PAS domain-containing sensor histidine kinase [Candidatus Cyclobacteriaceae bacterium M3_2C_046]
MINVNQSQVHQIHSQLINFSNVSISVFSSPDLKYLFVNPEAQRRLAINGKINIIGKTLSEVWQTDSSLPEELIGQVLKTKRPFIVEAYKFTYPDNSDHYFNLVIHPVLMENEIISHVILYSTDVTKDVQSDKHKSLIIKQLKESHQQLELLINNSQDGIHLLNLKTNQYEFMNPAQERLTGFPLHELMLDMDAAAQRLHPDDVPVVNDYLNRVINDQYPGNPVEYRWKVKSGEYRWFSDNRNLIKDRAGNPDKLVGVSRDITERKKTELLLNNAFNLQKDLLYIAAHDLKSPISNMKMMLDLLKKQKFSQNEFQDLFSNQIVKLESVMKGITEILEVQSRDNELMGEDIKLFQLIRYLELQYQSGINACKGTIKNKIDPEFSFRYVNSFMQSILSNLISNAIKYRSEDRPLVIDISAEKQADQVIVTIKDNGMGMNLDKIDNHLFKPFKRFNQNSAEGTGVGLYIIKNLISRNGGHIEVESTVNEGTTFICHLNIYN